LPHCARGLAFAAEVTDGFFPVGLSNVDADRACNIQPLEERSWFGVPLVHVNQRRAIIAIEKAPRRARVQRRVRAWGRKRPVGGPHDPRCRPLSEPTSSL